MTTFHFNLESPGNSTEAEQKHLGRCVRKAEGRFTKPQFGEWGMSINSI